MPVYAYMQRVCVCQQHSPHILSSSSEWWWLLCAADCNPVNWSSQEQEDFPFFILQYNYSHSVEMLVA